MLQQAAHLVLLSGGLLLAMPLLLLATLAVGIDRWWLLRRTLGQGGAAQRALARVDGRNRGALHTVAEQLGNTLGGHLAATAAGSSARTAEALELQLDEVITRATPLLTRRMWVLDTSVTIAPLLGLFGTIIGLMQTFNVLSAHGGPAEVTGGIADALVSTAAGVMIAIVAVCFLNGLNAALTGITFQLESIKLSLLNRVLGEAAEPPVRPVRPVPQPLGA